MQYMKNNLVVPVCLLVLVLAAIVLAGCVSPSPEIVSPKTRVTMADTVKAGDCFFRVNDSAHTMSRGSSRQLTVTGYISNTCTQPMENMAVRGIFYDKSGKAFASAETAVGHVGYHDVVPFTISANTRYPDLYTYTLQPVIRDQRALF